MATRILDLGLVKGADGAAGPQGPAGAQGAQGPAGKSPYQCAVEAGYTGTEAEFYAALVSLKNGPFLPLIGGTMSGPLNIKDENRPDGGMVQFYYTEDAAYTYPVLTLRQIANGQLRSNGINVAGIEQPTSDDGAANKKYVDDKDATLLPKSGGTMTGALYAKDDAAYTTAKVRNIKFGTTDLTAGTSSLSSGQIAMIYE